MESKNLKRTRKESQVVDFDNSKKRRLNESSAVLQSESVEDEQDEGEPVVQRSAANERERQRMRVLSKAFVKLKATLPWVPEDTKLSKLDTLRLASCYIAHLDAVLAAADGRYHPLLPSGMLQSHPTTAATAFGFPSLFVAGTTAQTRASSGIRGVQHHSSISQSAQRPAQCVGNSGTGFTFLRRDLATGSATTTRQTDAKPSRAILSGALKPPTMIDVNTWALQSIQNYSQYFYNTSPRGNPPTVSTTTSNSRLQTSTLPSFSASVTASACMLTGNTNTTNTRLPANSTS